jgi:hypothetical protein
MCFHSLDCVGAKIGVDLTGVDFKGGDRSTKKDAENASSSAKPEAKKSKPKARKEAQAEKNDKKQADKKNKELLAKKNSDPIKTKNDPKGNKKEAEDDENEDDDEDEDGDGGEEEAKDVGNHTSEKVSEKNNSDKSDEENLKDLATSYTKFSTRMRKIEKLQPDAKMIDVLKWMLANACNLSKKVRESQKTYSSEKVKIRVNDDSERDENGVKSADIFAVFNNLRVQKAVDSLIESVNSAIKRIRDGNDVEDNDVEYALDVIDIVKSSVTLYDDVRIKLKSNYSERLSASLFPAVDTEILEKCYRQIMIDMFDKIKSKVKGEKHIDTKLDEYKDKFNK